MLRCKYFCHFFQFVGQSGFDEVMEEVNDFQRDRVYLI